MSDTDSQFPIQSLSWNSFKFCRKKNLQKMMQSYRYSTSSTPLFENMSLHLIQEVSFRWNEDFSTTLLRYSHFTVLRGHLLWGVDYPQVRSWTFLRERWENTTHRASCLPPRRAQINACHGNSHQYMVSCHMVSKKEGIQELNEHIKHEAHHTPYPLILSTKFESIITNQ